LVGVALATFFGSTSLALAAPEQRRIEISVTVKGFEPARVEVVKDQPLQLVVTRKTDQTCAKQILIPDANIKADLPLDKPVTFSFTPKRSGELKYTCGMNMITGVLQVTSRDSTPANRSSAGAIRSHTGTDDPWR
jgi:plastocyanin domain-containing protein